MLHLLIAKIESNKMTFSVDRKECHVKYSGGMVAVCGVNLKQTEIIPSGNEMLLVVKVKKRVRGLENSGNFLFEAKQRFENHDKICVACGLTEGNDTCTCIIRVINISSEDVTLYKNTTVAYLLPVKKKLPCNSMKQQIAAPGEQTIFNCSMLEQKLAAPGTAFEGKVRKMVALEQQLAAPSNVITRYNQDGWIAET